MVKSTSKTIKPSINQSLANSMAYRRNKERESIIIDCVAWYCKVSVDDILGSGRSGDVAEARQIAMFIMRESLKYPITLIAKIFNRSHPTVIHSVELMEFRTKQDLRTRLKYNQIITALPTMTLNEYQELALETAIYPEEQRIIYPTLGLTGEAGEVSDKVKKVLRDNNSEFSDDRKEAILMEAGDCLWYLATLCHDLGYTLEECAERNYQKLRSRQERGRLSGSGDNR